MKQYSVRIRGYTKEYCKNGFVAVSVELGLATQGDSNEQTREDMVNRLACIALDYIESAFEQQEFTHQLLTRKAGISQRLKYYLIRSLGFTKLDTFFMKKYKTFHVDLSVITS